MNKLNKLGDELYELKRELQNEHSELVLKCISEFIDKYSVDNIIDADVHYALKENSIPIENFKEMLLNGEKYYKTKEQLIEEYELIRQQINDNLENYKDGSIKTFNNVDEEIIIISKEFVISEEFTKSFFAIESDEVYEKLMGRKNFIEKFAILRLTKILKDFISMQEVDNDKFSLVNSNVFYNSERNLYGIYLIFNIPIENIETDSSMDYILGEINYLIEQANLHYDEQMS